MGAFYGKRIRSGKMTLEEVRSIGAQQQKNG